MSSEISAIRDLKKGTGSDRGHLTKKRSKALCQKVSFCSVFVIVEGTPASGLAVSTDMCGECAPNTAVSHKIAAAKKWKKHIPLRQGQVTLSSVIQRAEQKNGILSVIGFKFFTKSALQKLTKNVV